MPYLITKQRPLVTPLAPSFQQIVKARKEQWPRHAVATLDHAITRVFDECPDLPDWQERCEAIPEEGGTVGPLPNGTVMQVEQVTYQWLAEQINAHNDDPETGPPDYAEGMQHGPLSALAPAILEAFNALSVAW